MAKKKQKRPESEPPVVGDSNEAKDESENVNDDFLKIKKKRKKSLEKKTGKEELIESNMKPSVTVALPGSIIHNAQSLELATRLAGQIARAATIFRIEEIVVFDSGNGSRTGAGGIGVDTSDENESGAAFLIRILRYLETPQYLRKALFPKHSCYRFVGLLPPLDAPHHLRKHEWGPYREGVTLEEGVPKNMGMGTLVDVGLSKNVLINQVLEPGMRVTVAMGTTGNLEGYCLGNKFLASSSVKVQVIVISGMERESLSLTLNVRAEELEDRPYHIVASSKPMEEAGLYWGYRVRYASNLSAVFKESPHKGGYDILIGTSEHGKVVSSSELTIPSFRHLLIAFGGLAGLEKSIEEDDNLKGKSAQELFNFYLNTCPNQGSRTIRTEEAIFICLQYFQEPTNRAIQRSEHP